MANAEKTMSATDAYNEVQGHIESIKNDADHRIETCSPGDSWAQGDILLTNIAKLPENVKEVPVEIQLAPGSTQGSRHCLDSAQDIQMFKLNDATPLNGPVLLAGREFTVQHPEHGNITLPAGCYFVTYQRAYAEELRAVRD